MPWWILLGLLFIVWLLWGVSAAAEKSAAEAEKGIPHGERRGVSIAPIIPLFPIVLFGIAKLVDLFIYPWGTRTMATLHAVLALIFIYSLVRGLIRLRAADAARS